jgi:hypothetical protein
MRLRAMAYLGENGPFLEVLYNNTLNPLPTPYQLKIAM